MVLKNLKNGKTHEKKKPHSNKKRKESPYKDVFLSRMDWTTIRVLVVSFLTPSEWTGLDPSLKDSFLRKKRQEKDKRRTLFQVNQSNGLGWDLPSNVSGRCISLTFKTEDTVKDFQVKAIEENGKTKIQSISRDGISTEDTYTRNLGNRKGVLYEKEERLQVKSNGWRKVCFSPKMMILRRLVVPSIFSPLDVSLHTKILLLSVFRFLKRNYFMFLLSRKEEDVNPSDEPLFCLSAVTAFHLILVSLLYFVFPASQESLPGKRLLRKTLSSQGSCHSFPFQTATM